MAILPYCHIWDRVGDGLKKKPNTGSWLRKTPPPSLPVVPYKKITSTPYLSRPPPTAYQVYPSFGGQPWSSGYYPPVTSYPVNKTMGYPPVYSTTKNFHYVKHYPKSTYFKGFRFPPQKPFGFTQKKYKAGLLPKDPFHEYPPPSQRPYKKSPPPSQRSPDKKSPPPPPPASAPKLIPKTSCVSETNFDFDEFKAQLHGKTTVMVKNIPNKIRMKLLLSYLDKHCLEENEKMKKSEETSDDSSAEYGFVYLPMDFKYNLNLGYAFINFTNTIAAVKFYKAYHNFVWGKIISSPKICEIKHARIQGKHELERHFQKSSFLCHTDEYLPTVFSPPRNGANSSVSAPRVVGRRRRA